MMGASFLNNLSRNAPLPPQVHTVHLPGSIQQSCVLLEWQIVPTVEMTIACAYVLQAMPMKMIKVQSRKQQQQ